MSKLLVKIIRVYQILTATKAPSCKFVPSCSNYAIQAVEKYGILKGLGLAVYRVLRCNPFSKGGYDPVP